MKQKLFDKFAELFGNADGAHFYFSPGRVNLIGEHTDYNGGHVFPCALTMGTYGAARKRDDRKVHFYSMNLDKFGVVEASLDDLTKKRNITGQTTRLGSYGPLPRKAIFWTAALIWSSGEISPTDPDFPLPHPWKFSQALS